MYAAYTQSLWPDGLRSKDTGAAGRPCEAEFEVTKEYAGHLRENVGVFKQHTHPEKMCPSPCSAFLGAKRNEHFLATVAQDLTLDVLFD